MVSNPKIPDNLDELLGLEEFLEFNDTIKECLIQDDNLKNFELDEVIVSYCKFKNVSFNESNLPKGTYNDVIFENCDFSSANLEKSTFKRVVFNNCKLTGTILNNSYFENVSFTSVEVVITGIAPSSILDDTNCSSDIFSKCNLNGASISGITFKNLEFEDCDLSETNFTTTHMNGLDLRSCDISGIITYIDDLKGVILTSAQSLSFIKLLGITVIDDE